MLEVAFIETVEVFVSRAYFKLKVNVKMRYVLVVEKGKKFPEIASLISVLR